MKFSDFLNNKQPIGWQPDNEYSIVDIEKDYKINTPNGEKYLFLIYVIVEYRPSYKTAVKEDDPMMQIEPVEIIKIYPVVQFEENYIKSAILTGPPVGLDQKSKLDWARREFNSKHNHFHILSKEIKNQIESICEKIAEEKLSEERSDYE